MLRTNKVAHSINTNIYKHFYKEVEVFDCYHGIILSQHQGIKTSKRKLAICSRKKYGNIHSLVQKEGKKDNKIWNFPI